ncbi:UDP-glucose 4-epimerase GalE [Halarcobacter sp.]|uniref:UDP-glucose 4-epimerase GalE n=1 Tax=Halarcobacter sp. TaxID=2321133 RepID=UPI002AA8A9A3|nr:UDP-glucose 4-epimerase GalE [Halarcobacter sp.]
MSSCKITGGAGYIGSHVAKQLLEKISHNVIIVDNLSTGHIDTIKKLKEIKDFRFVELDLSQYFLLNGLFKKEKFDVIIHFAGSSIVSESIKNLIKYYTNNTFNTANLIKCTIYNNVKKFIFSSLAAVYGELKNNKEIEESFETKLINPYGMSKLMSEDILKDSFSKNRDFKYIIFRYFNIAGVDIFYDKGELSPRIGEKHEPEIHFISLIVKVITGKKDTLSIYRDDFDTKDGTCIRDYIHVEDLANAHVEAIEYLDLNDSDIFNSGFGKGYSVKEIISTMEKVIQKELNQKIDKRREGYPFFSGANNNKIIESKGWKSMYDNLELICKNAYA